MLSKINHLTNFGNYRQFQWGSTAPFSKRNLIYGWNYSGKTTLSRLFQILADPNQLLKSPGCQFEIELQDGSLISQASLTSNLCIKVFNRDFIQQNFQQEHKAPAVFIVGGNIIHLRNRIVRLNEHENKVQAINARLIGDHRRLQSELDQLGTNHARNVATLISDRAYNRTKLIAEIDRVKAEPDTFILSDEDLEAKVSLLRSTEQWAEINPISTPVENPETLRQTLLAVLTMTASNEAIAKLQTNRELESWIRIGLSHHTDSTQCEFCGSTIPEARLSALQKHFSEAYEQLAAEVASCISTLEKTDMSIVLPDERDFIPDIRAQFTALKAKIADWNAWAGLAMCELVQLAKNKQLRLEAPLHCNVDTSRALEASQLLADINAIISTHNQKRVQIDSEKRAAKEAIEKHEAASFYHDNNIRGREAAIQAASDQVNNAQLLLSSIMTKKGLIEAQIQQQSIAAQKINETVRFLLPDNSILVADLDGSSFEFLRDGTPAINLSDGEKTAITFAYFLATLEGNGSSPAQTVVFVDDPISSLDSNHIYSIYALITSKLDSFLQIFVSTHNSELYTLLKDHWFYVNQQYANRSDACAYYTRRYLDGAANKWHSTLEDTPNLLRKYKSEYQFVFDQLHCFSSSPAPTIHEAYTSPNLLRKFLEAYLGFRKPCVSKWSNKLDLLFDEDVDRVEIQKFADDASHLQGLSQALQQPSFIPNSQHTVTKVIQALKAKDSSHYISMCTVIGVAP
jgi:wobble nucleotide-excising tRNase